MRLGFATAFSAAVRTLAEIGLRRFSEAARTLGRAERSARELDDPWLRTSTQILRIKLALSQGSPIGPLDTCIAGGERISPILRGELLAVKALALAATGQHDSALSVARGVHGLTRSIEARLLAELAELVIKIELGQSWAESAASLISRAVNEEMLDPTLLALRTSHSALMNLWDLAETRPLVSELIIRTGDRQLAAAIGISIGTASELLEQLTPREREVLLLLTRGMSNREIAKTLVIEASTVKAHVHHILTKLGAKNRLQAILIAHAEDLESEV
jgi:ATP/maltotriose-dependent transcriptional regulator MalT